MAMLPANPASQQTRDFLSTTNDMHGSFLSSPILIIQVESTTEFQVILYPRDPITF